MSTSFHSGSARGGSISSVILDKNASPISGFYTAMRVKLVSGCASGQFAEIIRYDGPSRTADIRGSWAIVPDFSTEYLIEIP